MECLPERVEEGDLLAYLDGKRSRHIKRALKQSPELRERLDQLQCSIRQFKRLFRDADLRKPLV
ncbi:MAG: hypothetical protein MI924_37160 [Chloroflexales bacterium]|nr:hypothetical protein [Chloroflexales bacterium]